MEDGKARMFTWVMDAKSVVTSPCPEKAIMHKGTQLLKGLAWSGQGKITRVDVSLDGGQNWQTAELHGPVLDKSLTVSHYHLIGMVKKCSSSPALLMRPAMCSLPSNSFKLNRREFYLSQ